MISTLKDEDMPTISLKDSKISRRLSQDLKVPYRKK